MASHKSIQNTVGIKFSMVNLLLTDIKGNVSFSLIKKTSKTNPENLVSAYKDNVAFIKGPKIQQFSPKSADKSEFYKTTEIETVISLKAETH